VRTHKDNTFGSVGILRRILELLNILRKEGFARVHRQRKEDALNISIRLRENLSKNGVERQVLHRDNCKSILQDQEEEREVAKGAQESRKGIRNLGGFQAEKSHRRVCIELWKE
jgi:hypothetical protein